MPSATEQAQQLSSRLLALASCRSTSSAVLLRAILQQAEQIETCDAAAGIFVLEPWSPQPKVAASAASGHLRASFPALVQGWLDQALAAKDGVSALRAPLRCGARSEGSRRLCLRVPMLEGQGIVAGALYLESSRRGSYTDQQVAGLELLAASALPAAYRTILRERLPRAGAILDLIGHSPAFLGLERSVRLAARHADSPALVTGERGSGKELTAWAIHAWSRRWERPFVPVLVSALAEGLYADELFGHERHSFTGAATERHGKFKAADGGTLFLDEVGDLVPEVQSALLRILESGELSPIGRDLPLRVDVRVVAATNLELARLTEQRRFRQDLYDRLSVFELRVPPLRERREDIPLLVNHFLARHCADASRRSLLQHAIGCPVCDLQAPLPCVSAAFYEALQAYSWPGNVRELHHVVLRLLAAVPDEILDVRHLPRRYLESPPAGRRMEGDLSLHAAVRSHIERVLELSCYNQSSAARRLGIPLSTLRSKLKRYEIDVLPPAAPPSTRSRVPRRPRGTQLA